MVRKVNEIIHLWARYSSWFIDNILVSKTVPILLILFHLYLYVYVCVNIVSNKRMLVVTLHGYIWSVNSQRQALSRVIPCLEYVNFESTGHPLMTFNWPSLPSVS